MGLKAGDYSVTWDDIKERTEKWLKNKGINGNDKIPMGSITYAINRAWDSFLEEKDGEQE